MGTTLLIRPRHPNSKDQPCVHLSVDIYIQITFSQLEYYDSTLDEIVVEKKDIIDESEVLVAVYEEVVNEGLKKTDVTEYDVRETDVREML